MIRAFPTKKGTGITIYGDYYDLTVLHDVIHEIAMTLDAYNESQCGKHQLLMNFAYEIRKAKEQSRKIEKFDIDGEQVTYYGAQIIWPDILIFTNVLRQYAGFIAMDKLAQSTLYLLEYSIENAMIEYDEMGAKDLKSLISTGLYTDQKYIFQIYQTVHSDFISQPTGKKRFRKLNDLLIAYILPFADLNKYVISNLEKSAKEFNCRVLDIEVGTFPDSVW